MTEAQRRRLEERKKRMQEEAAADAAASRRPTPKKTARDLAAEYGEYLKGLTTEEKTVRPQAKRQVPRRTTADVKPSGLVTRREEPGKPTTPSNWSDRTTPKHQTPRRNPDYQEPRTFGERTDLARAAALPETSSSYRQLADWYNAESKKTDYQRAVEAEDQRVFEEGGYAALYERWLKREQAKKNEGRKPATMMEWVPNERGELTYTKVPVSKPYSDPEYDKMRAEEVKDTRLADMGTMYGYVAEIAQMPTQAVLAIEKMAEAYNGLRSGKYTEQDAARMNEEAATTLRVALGDGYDEAHVGDLAVALSRYRNMTDEQKAQEEYARRLQAGESGTLGENLATFGQNLSGGLTGAGAALGDAIGSLLGTTEYHHMDPNDAAYAATRAAQRTRSLTASAVEGEDPNFIRKAGSYLYQGAMSAGDNIIRAAVGMVTGMPGLSLALAGASSFGQGYQEAASRGGNRLQATLYGAATGGLEIVTEKLPLDRLLQVPEEGLKNAIADILTSAAIEVGEEEASYFGGMIADAIIMGKNSENQIRLQELMAEGKTEDEAWDILLKEILQEATDTAITSALSSGIMTGGKYAIFGGSQSDTAEPDKITDDITTEVNEETPEAPAEAGTNQQQRQPQQGTQTEYRTVTEAAKAIPTSMRGKFQELYDGTSDLTAYTKGWQALVLEGKRSVGNPDVTLDDATKRWTAFTSAMSDDARIAAFAYGQTSGKSTGKPLTAGRVTFEGDESRLTPKQKTNLEGLRLVAEALNVPVSVFESDMSPETGGRVGANGWYDPKDGSIHIDLNAGADGAGTMLFTASHEVVHLIRDRAPKAFDALGKFLSDEYGTDLEGLVEEQIAKAERTGRTIDRDEAFEEVVADSMETMLTDKDVVRRLNNLRNRDKNLWQRIKSFFSNLVSRIQKAYRGLKPDSREGKLVKGMLDKAQEIRDLFVAGVEEAAGKAGARGDEQRYSYAGARAKTADTGRLSQAEELEKQGKSNEEIRQQTGWFKGMDGKWRFEIDDSKTVFDFSVFDGVTGEKTVKLPLVMKNTELYTAYPDLRNVDVQWVARAMSGESGSAESEGDYHVITLVSSDETDKEEVLTHEVQHIIQSLEGFAEGGNVGLYYAAAGGDEAVAFDMYQRTAGEIEARDTAARRGMSAEERAKKRPDLRSQVVFSEPYQQEEQRRKAENVMRDAERIQTGKIQTAGVEGADVQRLAEDMREHGWSGRPVILVESGGKYYPLTGEKRIAAARLAGIDVVALVERGRYAERAAKATGDERGRIIEEGAAMGEIFYRDQYVREEQIHQRYGSRGAADRVRYSQRESTEKEQKQAEEISRLRELVELQGKVTGGKVVKRESVKKIARDMMKQAGAKGNVDELTGMLMDVYSMIAKGEELTWEDVQEAAEPAAQWIQEHTPKTVDPYAEAALADMKGKAVKLNIHQKQEILSQYGSMAAFRKAIGGAVEIRDDGLELDVFFREMAETHPGVFDVSISDAQMGVELADIVDRLRNMESADSQEAEYYADEIRDDLIRQVYEGYWETDMLKTVADKYQDRITRLKLRHDEAMRKQRDTERQKRDKLADELRKKRKDIRREMEEKQETYRLRGTVYKQAKSLIRKLNENSKGQHVPAPLRKVLGEFAESLDLLSKTSHAKGELTKADNRMVSSLEKLRGMLTAATNTEAKVFGNFVSIDGVILDIAPEVAGQLDPIIQSVNDAIRKWNESGNEGNALYSMSKAQLDALHETLTQILTAVGNANTILSGEAGRRSDVYAKRAIREYDSMKVAKKEHAIDWNLMTPFFFFKRMGGAAAHIWEGFKEGMNKMARLRKQVEDFSRKTWKPKEIKAWQKKIITYKTEAGEEIQLTEAQVMSLYIASKREQAQLHMFDRGDGIQIGEIKQTGKANIVDKQNHKITPQDVANLVDMLSDKKRQLEVADAIQEFMSTVGAKLGNEVTLKRWGIKRFGEKYYFPIKVVSGSKDVQADKIRNEQYRLLNLGMTKDTKEGVTEAMIIDGIFDVFADHMSEMIRYNSFALPILDAMRWVNFTDRVSDEQGGTKKGQSVHGAMEKAFGKKAVGFFLDMVGALNSNKTGENDPTGKVTRFLNAMWKRSVIFHSLSTAVKQPLSYIRASYVLSAKYMTKAFGRIPDSKMKQEREQMYRENGIAEWKGQGYMDANMSRGMSDAFKQERTFGQRWEDSAMWLASKMDELTWTRLWIACKWQACKGDPKLYGAAETLAEAKRLFEDAIYGTQVVDSPLTRSQWSRNNNLFNSMFVPFSSEGNVAYNVMMDGVRLYGDEVRRTDRKTAAKKYGGKIARGISVYMAGQVADAILESLIAANRDDDEFKTYWEKFMEALLGEGVMQGDMLGLLGGNLFDSMNPLNNMANLQVITDSILSATKGYSNERTDTATLVKLIELGKMWYEYAGIKNGTIEEPTKLTGYGRKTMEGMMYDTLRTLDRVFGTGVGNIARTVVTAYNNVVDVYNRTREPGEKKAERFIRYDGFTENAVKQAYEDGYLSLQEAGRQIQEARSHAGKDAYTDNELYWVLKKMETGAGKNDGIDLAVLSGNLDDMKDAQSEIIEFSDKQPDNPLRDSIVRVYKDSLRPAEDRNKAYNGQTITRDEAYKLLMEVAGLSDREAFASLEKAEYAISTGSDDGYSVYNGVYEAMVSGGDVEAAILALEDEGYLPSEVKSDVQRKITTAYKDGKLSKEQVTRILRDYYGVTEKKDFYKYFDRAEHELEYGENYTVYRDVYAAVESGGSIDAAMSQLVKNGFDEKQVREQAVGRVRDLYVKEGKITEAKAAELLARYARTTEDLSEKGKRAYFEQYGVIPKNGESRYLTADEQFWKMDEWTWKKQNPDSKEDYDRYTKWYDSMESGEKLKETIKYYEEHGVDKSKLSRMISEKYKSAYVEAMLSGDRETARKLRRMMIKAWSYLGYDTDDKLETLQDWVTEEKNNRR